MGGYEVEYKVSLDNLTVVGIPKFNPNVIREMLISKGCINNFWQTAHGRYFDNYTILGGGYLQVTHEKGFVDGDKFTVHQIRFEFNPNNIINYKKLTAEYLDILRLILDPKITRKDIAIDLMGVDLNDFTILDYSSRKRIEYKTGGMVLETLYFGSKHSDERHRIYNKALEQGLLTNRSKEGEKTTEKQEGLKWWRVEAQLRKEKAEMRKYNAFTKIRIASKQDFFHHDVRTRAMLFYLQANPDALNELSVNARTKYKKLLGEQIEGWYIDLETMAENSLDDIQTLIEGWLNFCPVDTSEGFLVKGLPTCLSLKDEPFTEKQKEELKKALEEWEEGKFEDIVSRGTKEDFDKWVKENELE